jgi:multidrug resistance efflux pump
VKLENKLKQIVRDNKRLNINVEKYEGLIEQAKEDIKMNLKDQEDFKNNIKTHQKELDEIKEKLKNVE